MKMGLKAGSKSSKSGKQGNSKLNSGKFQQSNSAQSDLGSDDELRFDASVLRPSIEIKVNGFSDLIKAFTAATEEIRNIISYECELIYECKVCRNLFRSMANLVSHKRVYCRAPYCAAKHTHNRNDSAEDFTWVIQPEPVPNCSKQPDDWRTSDMIPEFTTANVIAPSMSAYSNRKKDLSKIIETLAQKSSMQAVTETVGHISAARFYEDITNNLIVQSNKRKEHAIQLENMETTRFGVYQTKLNATTTTTSTINLESTDLMKAQISEIHRIEADNEATLDANGQVLDIMNGFSRKMDASGKEIASERTMDLDTILSQGSGKEEHVCAQCNQRFSTRKTLSHHVKSLHVMFRMCYPCPCCKSVFVNTWSVYRHLYKVHRKTTAQVRKLRPQIQKKAFRKDKTMEAAPSSPTSSLKNATLKELQRLDQENQAWMDNFEDDQELQRCGGCGRRFERRAALNSHSQICQKRIAARNNVKAHRTLTATSNGTAADKVTKHNHVPQTENESLEIIVENGKKTESISSSSSKSSLDSNSSSPYSRVQQGSNTSWSDPSKKDIPEKKIEIQIRRDYCKIGGSNSGITLMPDMQSELDSRPQSSAAGDEGDDDCYDDNITGWGTEILQSEVGKDNILCSSMKLNNVNPRVILKRCISENEMNIGGNSVKSVDATSEQDLITRRGVKLIANDTNYENLQIGPEIQFGCIGSENNVFPFHIKCEENVLNQQTPCDANPPLNECSQELSTSNQDDENSQVVSVARLVMSTNPPRKRRNKRKRPSSAVVRQPQVNIESSRQGIVEQSIQKPLKVSGTKRRRKMDQFSPIMQSKMQELINERRLQCLPCQKKFNKLTNLRRHVANHIGWSRYQCVVCPYKCFSKYDCVAHVSKVHLKGGVRSKAMSMVQCIDTQGELPESIIENLKIPVQPTENGDNATRSGAMATSPIKSDEQNLLPSEIAESTDSADENPEFSDSSLHEGTMSEQNDFSECMRQEDAKKSSLCSHPPHPEGANNTDESTNEVARRKESTITPKVDVESLPSTSIDSRQEQEEEFSNKKLLGQINGEHKEDADEKNTSGDKLENEDTFSPIDERSLQTSEINLTANQEEDPSALQKMVMEVIFGSSSDPDLGINQNFFSLSNNDAHSEKLSSRPSSTDSELESIMDQSCGLLPHEAVSPFPTDNVSTVKSTNTKESKPQTSHVNTTEIERRERPVRNRVKVTREDFIYDLSDACLNPKKDSDGQSKSVNKRKQYDSVKELLKQGLEHTSVENNFEVLKCVPKLMLVRTDVGETSGGKRTGAGSRGTWSSSYSSQTSECNNEKSATVNSLQTSSGYNISTRKSQRVFVTKPLKSMDSKEKHLLENKF